MIHSFKLTIDSATGAPVITVEDLTVEGTPAARLELGAEAALPYQLAVDQAPDNDARLVVRQNEPFDPQVTRDSNVLHVETFITDHRFGTQDDTRYLVHVTNKSRYYLAEDIHVHVQLDPAEQPRLPDENLSLSITPAEQHIQCIDPGKTSQLTFVAISRGPAPGVYKVEISLTYRLLYWDGRRARARTEHSLPVQGAGIWFDIPKTPPAARMPPQPASPRSNAMSHERQQKAFFAPLPAKTHHHHLKPIEQHFPLPGEGHLCVAYRLLKGHHHDPAEASCSYGRHPDSDEIESYFSTQDAAALEVTLRNESHHHLKHVRLSGIHLMSIHPEKATASAVKDTLPDGNLLFEVIPGDVYFGHLAPHGESSKYLSLITRGVAPGHYAVKLQVNYDIEQCHLPVDLWLTVRPD